MINKWLLILLVAFGLIFLGITPFSYAASDYKFAYVDLSKVFDQYERTKESDKMLEKKASERQAQRDKSVEEIKKLKDEAELLSAKAKEEKQKLIDEKIQKLQDLDREVSTSLKKEKDEMLRDILKDIDKVITDYGKSEKYTIIFDDRFLLYKDTQLNITDQVIKILNERYKKR
jgi:Skp family chaperone for outer membrane proteins